MVLWVQSGLPVPQEVTEVKVQGQREGLLQGCRGCVGTATPTKLSTAVPPVISLWTCNRRWKAYLHASEAPRWTRQPSGRPEAWKLKWRELPPHASPLGSPRHRSWRRTLQRHGFPVP